MIKTIKESYNNVAFHYKEGNFNWPMIIYVGLVHIVATVGLFTIPKCSAETLFWAFILWPIRYVNHLVSFLFNLLSRVKM